MASDIWNSKVLKPPLFETFKCKAPDIDFSNVNSLLYEGINTHIVPNALRVESCVMRKVIYRLKLQFRHDKGFKFFEATNRYLNHFFNFSIAKELRYFLSYVPQKYEKVVTLPSKQMLEYLLVRLQGYAQVCARIVESSFNTTNFMKARLLLGHQWEIAIVVMAIASRIWFLCRHLTIKCCLLYNNLLPLLEQLQITGNKWLPDSYEFPTDLTTWLNYDWLIEKPDIIYELPLGLPKFSLIDDDDVEFIDQYRLNNTIIIPDDSDDESDKLTDVKFVCHLSNKKIKLNKKQARHLQSRLIINIDDSDSDEDQLVPSSSYNDILELLDDDIQIIDSPKNAMSIDDDIVEIDDTFDDKKTNTGLIGYNESYDEPVVEKEIIKDMVKDQEDIGEPVDEEIEVISEENGVSDEENKTNETIKDDKDIGEPISRQKVEEQEESEVEEDETDEEDDKDIGQPITRQEVEKQQESEAEAEESDEDEQEEEKEEENEKQHSLLAEMEEIEKPILIYEDLYKFDTIEKLESLLQKENFKRKTDKRRRCLFVNIPDSFWYHIAFHIKYFIAMTVDNIENRNKYIIKSKNLLASIALEKKISPYIPTLKNKFKAIEDPAPMSLKGKQYLINSIDSLSDLQVFISKEIHKRRKSREKSLFSNFNLNEWKEISSKIKYMIVMGMKKPIKSNIYVKKAKSKLTQLLLGENNNDSDVSSDDSDVEELKQKSLKHFDDIYKAITRDDSYSELFKYIQELEDFVSPPNMKKSLKQKIGRHLKRVRLNALIYGGNKNDDGSPPNKKKKLTNSSPLESSKENGDIPEEKPLKLTRSQKKKKLQKKKAAKLAEQKENEENNNPDQQIQQPTELTNKRTEKLFENILTTETYVIPTLNRKLRRKQRMEELEAKRKARNNSPPPSEEQNDQEESFASKSDDVDLWPNPLSNPEPLTDAQKEQLRLLEEQEKREKEEAEREKENEVKVKTEKEKQLDEQRKRIEEIFKTEEEERMRLEQADASHVITPQEREARERWLEQQISKIDEIWNIDEEEKNKLEQSRQRFLAYDVLRMYETPKAAKRRKNRENKAERMQLLEEKRREGELRRLRKLKSEHQDQLRGHVRLRWLEAQIEKLERQNVNRNRRLKQEPQQHVRLQIENSGPSISIPDNNMPIKIEPESPNDPNSEIFELIPPTISIKHDPDQKPVIKTENINAPSTSYSNNHSNQRNIQTKQQKRQEMERARMMRLRHEYEEEYRRRYELQCRLAYEERKFEEQMRQRYSSNRGPPVGDYRRPYEGDYRGPPGHPYGAYYY